MTEFTLTPEVREMRRKVTDFLNEHIYPNEESLMEADGDRESLMRELQAKTKAMGMWAPHLPAEAGGMGIGFMKYVYMNEILGRSPFAPRAFGAQAPDSGNAEILWQFGTDEQKQRWLKPLVNGDIRSCFSMTEPEVSGADPTGLQTRAAHEPDHRTHGLPWLRHRALGAGDGRNGRQPLRDLLPGLPRARDPHPRQRRRRGHDRPEASGATRHPPLHALAGPIAAGLRADVPAGAESRGFRQHAGSETDGAELDSGLRGGDPGQPAADPARRAKDRPGRRSA